MKVNENTNISRKKMMAQYNRNIVFYDYKPEDQVWLKRKNFKPGESKKLLPRKSGPWIVKKKLANGVNFEISNMKSKETKVVHHNRLTPVNNPIKKIKHTNTFPYSEKTTIPINNDNEITSSDDSSFSESEMSSSSDVENIEDETNRRYPLRNRTQRQIEGTVSWDQLPPI